MTNGQALKEVIDESGVSIVYLSRKMECSRNRIYAILKGADCTANEIVLFCELLHLSKQQRDYIFLHENVN